MMGPLPMILLTAPFLLSRTVEAAITPPSDGTVLACRSQGCNDCPVGASVNAGFPECFIYDSADTFGQDFAAPGGNGYNVWWDSGTPDSSCKIVVRTPASQELPACGYFLRSWAQAGCYFTAIQDSFMLQYCCGTEDCDTAVPAASIADAHAQALVGNATIVSLVVGNLDAMTEVGSREIEGVGKVSWKRSNYAPTRRQSVASKRQSEQDCAFHPTTDRITQADRQIKVSDTQVCNSPGGCALSVSTTVMIGQSINPTLTAHLFSFISAAVGYTFTESMSYTTSTTYTQIQGTTGYMTYNPTLNCWNGTFSGCLDLTNGQFSPIDPTTVFYACTPSIRQDGTLDGTFSFAYA